MKAHLRRVRISPKKVNVVAGIIRGKNALEALDLLKFTNKKGAVFLYKALLSAVSNAENNNGKTKKSLFIKEIVINKGPVFRRHVPSARGRALPLSKPTAHISIELIDKQ